MSELFRRQARLLLLAAVVTAAPVAGATPELERLLAASDPFAAAPREMRIELVFSRTASETRVPIELWRKGDELALIRFLAPKDRGKYVVRRDGAFFLLTPTAKNPVKLAPMLAPAGGAALDDLLSVRPSNDYAIGAATTNGGQVSFELDAHAGAVGPPHVTWVVDRQKRRPLRAEFRDRDNRVTRLVEFKSWRDGKRLEPLAIVAKDVARGGAPLEVEFLAIESRDVPPELFDLKDGAARGRLPVPELPAPASP